VDPKEIAEFVERAAQDGNGFVGAAEFMLLQRRGRRGRTGDLRSTGVHWRQGWVTRYPWQKVLLSRAR
jgi:hypothetical protein